MVFRIGLILIIILALLNVFSYEILLSEGATSFVYDSKGKRDPFIPLFTLQTRTYASLENIESIDDLILEGIIWDPKGGSVAILNGVILKEGDMVNNIYIMEITPSRVHLTINNQAFEVKLQKEVGNE